MQPERQLVGETSGTMRQYESSWNPPKCAERSLDVRSEPDHRELRTVRARTCRNRSTENRTNGSARRGYTESETCGAEVAQESNVRLISSTCSRSADDRAESAASGERSCRYGDGVWTES